jgi:hypothetical protein
MKALSKMFFVAVVLFLITAASALAACWDDILSQRDTTFLVMQSGAAYRIISDGRVAELWFPLSQVQVCEQEGYVEGQWMRYFEIRNSDAAGVVWAVPAQ